MRKIVLLLISLLITYSSSAQVKEIKGRQSFNQGDFEISFYTNLGKYSSSTKEISTYSGSQPYESSYSDGSIYLQVGASVGYYILNGWSIEPELDINLSFDGTSTSLLGNLCYTFYIPRKNIYPYIKLGYGLSNYHAGHYSNNSEGLFESLDYKTLNAGAGLKFKYSSGLALRMEINYRNLSGSNSYYYSDQYYSTSNKSETTISIISLAIGISVLL